MYWSKFLPPKAKNFENLNLDIVRNRNMQYNVIHAIILSFNEV